MLGKRRQKAPEFQLDEGMVVFGLVAGLIGGALFGLFKAPRSGAATRRHIASTVTETGDSIREKIDSVVPTIDPVSESIAEGKAAARRRRAELGLPELEG